MRRASLKSIRKSNREVSFTVPFSPAGEEKGTMPAAPFQAIGQGRREG
jgi:hypothetical protein